MTDILRLDGDVRSPCQLDRGDLRQAHESAQVADIGQVVPGRQGRALTLVGLMRLVGVNDSARFLGLHASRDDFHASIPLDAVKERGYLVFEQDELPLSAKQGGPFRFLIDDVESCHTSEIDECANVKFVDHIEFTKERGCDNRPEDDAQHAARHAHDD